MGLVSFFRFNYSYLGKCQGESHTTGICHLLVTHVNSLHIANGSVKDTVRVCLSRMSLVYSACF